MDLGFMSMHKFLQHENKLHLLPITWPNIESNDMIRIGADLINSHLPYDPLTSGTVT